MYIHINKYVLYYVLQNLKLFCLNYLVNLYIISLIYIMLLNKPAKTILIVGLGNPGYSKTRHNLGSDFLWFLFQDKKKEYIKPNLFIIKMFDKIFVVYLCPSVMNISGEQVKMAYNQFKCEQIIVFLDDIETNLGDYKISYGIGSNGHNGLKSIIKNIPGKKIFRFRLGVGRPTTQSINEFVLGVFSSDEMKLIIQMFEKLEKEWWTAINKKFVV